MKLTMSCFAAALLVLLLSAVGQANPWLIDFNSTTQDGGPHNQSGYEPYDAGHEVAADFVTKTYSVFGTTVSLTPTWPNTTDNRVQQMIDRGAGNDANYDGEKLDLVTDWLGIDTRTANGGNGDYDGTNGTPTLMDLTIGGLPAGPYHWQSFHHDPEFVNVPFLLDISTDGGSSFIRVGQFEMTASSVGGNVNDNQANPGTGNGPEVLSSTVNFDFSTRGDDVVLRFTPLSAANVHNQIFGINGFELTLVPEPAGLTLCLCGLVGLVGLARRRQSIAAW